MSHLVLSVREGESVYIGDDIVITVVEVRGQTSRISFEAPREMPILRGSVMERLRDREAELKAEYEDSQKSA